MKFNVSNLIRNQLWIINFLILAFIGILSITGCSSKYSENNEQLKASADSFAMFYFNWQFQKAIPYCTTDSKKWLCYAASNVHSADLDILRNKDDEASCYIQKIQLLNDSTAVILCTVNNYLCMDTIGKAGRIIHQSQFRLSLVFQDHQWKVRMEALPRSEKLNHD